MTECVQDSGYIEAVCCNLRTPCANAPGKGRQRLLKSKCHFIEVWKTKEISGTTFKAGRVLALKRERERELQEMLLMEVMREKRKDI